MSTNTKKIGFLSGILSAVKSLGNPETIEDNSLENCRDQVDEKTMKDFEEANKNIEKKGKEAEEFLVTAERIKKEMFSIDRVLNANTEAAMREYRDKLEISKNKPKKDKDIGEK